MRHSARLQKTILMTFLLTLITGGTPGLVTAQAPPNPPPQNQAPPSYPPKELDKLVSRIALYPDPLLAQILAGATYPDQIPDAAKWADEHHYLSGDDLARAITEDHLTWDPSVQALLPFPSVLDMMASDMNWTAELGNAFLAQQQDVMDAVQRMRKKARDYGYLKSNGQVVVAGGPYVTILPVNPAFVCVPVYDPLIVFAPPAARIFYRRRHRLWIWRDARLRVCPLGMGHQSLFLGSTRTVHRRCALGPELGQSRCLRASLPRFPTLEWASRRGAA